MKFTHGVAAKFINIYFKAMFWQKKAAKGWFKLSYSDYEDIIKHIKYVTKGHLWEIGEYWKIFEKNKEKNEYDNNPKWRCL